MTQKQRLEKLNFYLLEEMPQYREQAKMFGKDEPSQFNLFRSLVNVRPPKPADSEFLRLQDEFLQIETERKGITDIDKLAPIQDEIYLWQGDITTLRCDAVVNAANSFLLGCFCPCHGCIDNAIHTYSGIQLRLECAALMNEQGHEESAGQAKITKAYNLPSKFVIHTVGPIIDKSVSAKDEELLASCYISCLKLAERKKITSIAFCCISTGEFHFPNKRAAEIAINTVKEYKSATGKTAIGSGIKVIFNVFKNEDYEIYRELLRAN